MDDFDRIRSAFPEQPAPTPETTANARRKLQALTRQSAATRRRGRWYAAARSGRAGIALTGVMAAVALVALATPLLLSPDSGPDAASVPSTITPTPRLMTASQVLLDLAIKQEVDERVSGRYFRVRTLQLRSIEVGKAGAKYKLEQRRIAESWMPMRPMVQSWFGWVDLGSRPATPADQAKWKAQGSPRSWQLSYETDPVTMTPGPPVVNEMSFDDVPPGYFLSGDKPVSAQQIQALPTDPAKLRAVLSAGAQPGATQDEIDYLTFYAAGRLLFEMPSPPKLRGAALRVMSELPGAVLRENVLDPIGRTGTEITYTWTPPRAEPTARPTMFADLGMRFIVDNTSGRLLSSEAIGVKKGASVVLESGWTDESPSPPSPTIR
jgi:hypothetical protein